MPLMKIDTELMHLASSQISGGASDIQNSINHFRSIVTNLTSQGWVATSGDAFQHAHDRWNSAALQMHEAMLQMSAAAGQAGNNFGDANTSSTITTA